MLVTIQSRDHKEDLDVGGRKILKWILERYVEWDDMD
jgi:hypothetical protein